MARYIINSERKQVPRRRTKYSNRGRDLELIFEKWIDYINSSTHGMAMRLRPEKIIKRGQVYYSQKQPCDYIFVMPKGTWFIDAKQCDGEKWYPSKAPAHQLEALKKAQAMGHLGGFVIWFRALDPFCRDLRLIEDFSGSKTINHGEQFVFFENL